MKYFLIVLVTLVFQLIHTAVIACDVCEKQQPELLRGVTHGAGPQSDWDYVIVGGTALIVLVSLVYAVRWMIKPGERDKDHIKRSILNLNEL